MSLYYKVIDCYTTFTSSSTSQRGSIQFNEVSDSTISITTMAASGGNSYPGNARCKIEVLRDSTATINGTEYQVVKGERIEVYYNVRQSTVTKYIKILNADDTTKTTVSTATGTAEISFS